MSVRVVFYCDLDPMTGTGHVMRCVALAEELTRRGVCCEFVADFASVPWVADQVSCRGFVLHSDAGGPESALARIRATDPDALVIDSYQAPSWLSDAVREDGVPVLAVVDGEMGRRPADIHVDQFPAGSVAVHRDGGLALTGLRYALVRDEVVTHRPSRVENRLRSGVPKVLAFFGGTDAYGAGPTVAAALVATGARFTATMIAPHAELRDAIEQVTLHDGQHIEVTGPPPSLMALAVEADLVIGAAGTSLVELLCIGAAAAIVSVVGNQQASYALAVDGGLAAGLGELTTMRQDPGRAILTLRTLLEDQSLRDRLRRRAWSSVDGRGRERVSEALMHVIHGVELQR